MLYPDLRGPEDVTGGVKRHANAVDVDRRRVFDGLDARTRAEPSSKDMTSVVRGQVVPRTPARVIAMRVRNHCPVDGRPGVDEEPAGFAEKAAVSRAEEQLRLV